MSSRLQQPRAAATGGDDDAGTGVKTKARPAARTPVVPAAASADSNGSQTISRNSGREFLNGAAASVVNILATFPLNKLISRQAYEGLSIREAFHTMRVDGMAHIYRGVFPPLMQKGVSLGVVYGAFDWYFHALTFAFTGKIEERAATDVPTGESSLAIRGAAAFLSGSTEALFTPFERLQTLLQHRHYHDAFTNTWDAAVKLRPYGLAEFYRGGSAILLRNGPSNAIFFLLREPVRNLIPPLPLPVSSSSSSPLPQSASSNNSSTASSNTGSGAAWNFLRDFFSGAVLGASLSTLFYPINTAKSVMQLTIGGRHRGVAETLRQVYHERQGFKGMYRGVGGNAVRALLSWGIINSSYEVAKRLDNKRLATKTAALA